jgi:hypothetical protein
MKRLFLRIEGREMLILQRVCEIIAIPLALYILYFEPGSTVSKAVFLGGILAYYGLFRFMLARSALI